VRLLLAWLVPRPQVSLTEREALAPGRLGAVAIIPARLHSTRLHEKALQDLGGVPLVVRVWEWVRGARALRDTWVATDSPRIADAVAAAGGQALLTSPEHPSGLDRVAEAARVLSDAPNADLVRLFEDREVRVGTLASPIANPREVEDPHRVKVVLDRNGRALYFSRAPIPSGHGPEVAPLLHIGIYAYRRKTLLDLAATPPSPLERAERLEQLRALWNGVPIHVVVGDYHSIGIDTPKDLARARARWAEGRSTP
jgi:3-deoxy-manno-octulosonate cytidylyltransferase (CMP-KDO synthetase)